MKRVLAGLVVVLLHGLVVLSLAQSRDSGTEQAEEFYGQTDTRRIELEVEKGARLVRMRLVLKAQAGQVAWKLLDPQGQVRGEGDVTEGHGYFEAEHQEPLRGLWVLELSQRQASGSYRVSWNVQ